MSRRSLLGAALVLVTLAAPPPAGASCGSDDCPLSMHSLNGASRFSFSAAYQFIDQDEVWVGSKQGTVGEPPSPEDEVRTRTSTVLLTGQMAVNSRLSLSATLPYMDRMHQHIANEQGLPPQPFEWDYSGLGDLMIMGQWRALGGQDARATSLSLQLGIKLPTGRTEVEPVDGQQPEPPARPGTGSVDGVAGFHVGRGIGAATGPGGAEGASVFLDLLGRVNGHGTDDYRVGNELQVTVGTGVPATRTLRLIGRVDARWRAKDDVGTTDALPDNTGGTFAYVTPGAELRLGSVLTAYGYVQVAAYRHVPRIEITAPYHLLTGLRWSLGI